jgi:hypothetical protein
MRDARRNVLTLAAANARGFSGHVVILSCDINAAVMPAATPAVNGEWQNSEWSKIPFTIHH